MLTGFWPCPAGGFKAKFHVGDTPMDVLAADGGNATAVGVLTGIYTKDELEKTGVGEQGLPPICCSCADAPMCMPHGR